MAILLGSKPRRYQNSYRSFYCPLPNEEVCTAILTVDLIVQEVYIERRDCEDIVLEDEKKEEEEERKRKEEEERKKKEEYNANNNATERRQTRPSSPYEPRPSRPTQPRQSNHKSCLKYVGVSPFSLYDNHLVHHPLRCDLLYHYFDSER